MAEILIYSTPVCPYCDRAKRFLTQKGASFTNIDITTAPHLRDEMMAKSGGRKTVPQIFINGTHIGGCDDLMALDRDGKLAPLLGAQ
jgi:glutaredoxin 3